MQLEAPADAPLLRRSLIPVFGDAYLLGILLACLAAVARAVGMLGPQRLFWVLPLGFAVMALTPLLFFRKEGRRRAGLRRPRQWRWVVWGVLLGALAAACCYWLGVTLFGDTNDNWFVSVRRSFPITPEMASLSTTRLFWIISLPSMIFSPVGEEIFFRGFLQQSLQERWSYRSSVLLDAGWFAAVHLFHHGIVRIEGRVEVFALSGVMWMLLIFGTGLLFALVRRKADSLLAPILSHAAFNLTMNFTIFTLL